MAKRNYLMRGATNNLSIQNQAMSDNDIWGGAYNPQTEQYAAQIFRDMARSGMTPDIHAARRQALKEFLRQGRALANMASTNYANEYNLNQQYAEEAKKGKLPKSSLNVTRTPIAEVGGGMPVMNNYLAQPTSIGGSSQEGYQVPYYDEPVLGSYRRGTPYVPKTGLYQLHQGEKVIPNGMDEADYYQLLRDQERAQYLAEREKRVADYERQQQYAQTFGPQSAATDQTPVMNYVVPEDQQAQYGENYLTNRLMPTMSDYEEGNAVNQGAFGTNMTGQPMTAPEQVDWSQVSSEPAAERTYAQPEGYGKTKQPTVSNEQIIQAYHDGIIGEKEMNARLNENAPEKVVNPVYKEGAGGVMYSIVNGKATPVQGYQGEVKAPKKDEGLVKLTENYDRSVKALEDDYDAALKDPIVSGNEAQKQEIIKNRNRKLREMVARYEPLFRQYGWTLPMDNAPATQGTAPNKQGRFTVTEIR